MKTMPFVRVAGLAMLVFGAVSAPAALKPALVFGSHMVLQRDAVVPVWGTASAGDKVVVSFAGQRKEAVADAQGAWRVALDPLGVSADPRTMTVAAGEGDKAETVTFEDVLVGDVWVGSGQSNMAMGAGGYTANDPVLAANLKATYPLLRLAGRAGGGGWKVATTNTSPGFSALLFSFGLPLQQELNVPVGLMCGAVGGTPSGYWLSEAAFKADAACQAEVAKAKAGFDEAGFDTQWAQQMATWSQAVVKAKADGTAEPKAPRRALKPGESLAPVGNLYEAHIRAYQPYAIRGVLWDQGESGTGIGNVPQDLLMHALVQGWRQEWGQTNLPFVVVQKPSGMGCALDLNDPVTRCGNVLAALPAKVPVDGGYREIHLRIGRIPGVVVVPVSDLGGGTHPVCKSGYGARAARVALGAVYGRAVESAGPTYQSHAIDGNKVHIQFDHVGQGLTVGPGKGGAPAALQGFAVAGTNRVFAWAKATVDGSSVVVESDVVPHPVAVRYAWSYEISWANLFNKDGLPAPTFRTDDWR